MKLAEGFENQRLCVLPAPLVEEALRSPVTRRLVVTHAGMFPRARDHERTRPAGSPEAIIMVCSEGSGWLEIGGARHPVGAGAAVVIPATLPHRYASSDTTPWTIWWCHLRGSDVDELVTATGATPASPVVTLSRPERAMALVAEAITATEHGPSVAGRIAAAGSAWNLLTHLAADRAAPGRGTPVERAVSFVEERFDAPVGVAELAALVGVSASHLSAQFREATGGGILAYQTGVRMSHARRLLDGTSMAIAQVAIAVGYVDPLYFSRRFHRTHGMSPSAYRAMRKG